MIKEAIEKILTLSTPNTIDYEGRNFVDKAMTPLPRNLTASYLSTNTLTSVVDYIKERADIFSLLENRFIVHIESPSKVMLYKEMNSDKNRDHLICAAANKCDFNFGRFMDLESFIINIQSNFIQNENTDSLLSFIGSVKDDTSVTQEDDGITQRVTAKSGISLSKTVKVPNPVRLMPYRTFTEVAQPESAFVFRMRKDGSSISAALFEADGNAWKNEAILNIKEFFKSSLSGEDVIILA